MEAILHDRVQIAKAVNATVITLDDAPHGYASSTRGVEEVRARPERLPGRGRRRLTARSAVDMGPAVGCSSPTAGPSLVSGSGDDAAPQDDPTGMREHCQVRERVGVVHDEVGLVPVLQLAG